MHPTQGWLTEFQWGGYGSPVTRTRPPIIPWLFWLFNGHCFSLSTSWLSHIFDEFLSGAGDIRWTTDECHCRALYSCSMWQSAVSGVFSEGQRVILCSQSSRIDAGRCQGSNHLLHLQHSALYRWHSGLNHSAGCGLQGWTVHPSTFLAKCRKSQLNQCRVDFLITNSSLTQQWVRDKNHSMSKSVDEWAWHCCDGSDVKTNNLTKRTIWCIHPECL